MIKDADCMICKHRRVFETEPEWLMCKCKLDDKMHDTMFPKCDGFEPEDKEDK